MILILKSKSCSSLIITYNEENTGSGMLKENDDLVKKISVRNFLV